MSWCPGVGVSACRRGGVAAWRLGTVAAWRRGGVAAWRRGCMESWNPNIRERWFRGVQIAWEHYVVECALLGLQESLSDRITDCVGNRKSVCLDAWETSCWGAQIDGMRGALELCGDSCLANWSSVIRLPWIVGRQTDGMPWIMGDQEE